jgi:hypothetical protein
MSDREILEMITQIQRLEYKEADLPYLLECLKAATRCPNVSDLIFYGDASDTPEVILQKARQYKPIQL